VTTVIIFSEEEELDLYGAIETHLLSVNASDYPPTNN